MLLAGNLLISQTIWTVISREGLTTDEPCQELNASIRLFFQYLRNKFTISDRHLYVGWLEVLAGWVFGRVDGWVVGWLAWCLVGWLLACLVG